MNSNKQKIKGLYLVTDTDIQGRFSHEDLTEQAIKGGVRVIQLRDKNASAGELLKTARRFVKICRQAGVISIINDRVDVALASDADGVHLGQNDLPVDVARKLLGPDKIIGGTASTSDEALLVEQQGADYVGFGHIFVTTTKIKTYPPRGLKMITELRSAVSIPVVAIGGIHAGNIRDVYDAGAHAAAVSSAICAANDPCQAASDILELVPVHIQAG